MKKLVLLLVLLLVPALAQPCRASTALEVNVSIDVLSDTHGADVHPYVQSLSTAMVKRWKLAAVTLPPEHGLDHHETILELKLGKDGRLLALRQQGTESDELWSHTAWEAAKDNVYDALPPNFKGAELELRLHFTRLQ